MNRKVWLPIAILGVGILLVVVMVVMRRSVPLTPPQPILPLVRVQPIAKQPFRFVVRAHGTVTPRTESDLVAQVEGEAVWVAPSFVPGGFFAKGETLVRIEPADYEADLETARARLARARSEFARASKERDRQRELAGQSIASESRIDDAENAYVVAQANQREAKARLGRAERDLERTDLKAPYDGRVREKKLDVTERFGESALAWRAGLGDREEMLRGELGEEEYEHVVERTGCILEGISEGLLRRSFWVFERQ